MYNSATACIRLDGSVVFNTWNDVGCYMGDIAHFMNDEFYYTPDKLRYVKSWTHKEAVTLAEFKKYLMPRTYNNCYVFIWHEQEQCFYHGDINDKQLVKL